MQTFLPYDNYDRCARLLDRQRLGKQRVEVLQILKVLNGETKGWKKHPAVLMWKGYTNELIVYGCVMCDEWKRRGYKDTCREKIVTYWDNLVEVIVPPWMGNNKLHFSHRANLYRKDPQYYEPRFGTYPIDVPYYWPSAWDRLPDTTVW